jgi:hypothetical protein
VLDSATSKSRPHHPPPERIRQLWNIFTENVDPLTKVVHVPSIRPMIENATENTKDLPRNLEAVMFAIYATAVMSMREDDCNHQLGESRKGLLSRYILATESALSRAKFLSTTSLVTLQALVLHLISIRDIYEPRAVWALTGVAIRIAQSMGMERDGEVLGLRPFETELRRRIWWQLKLHDFRTAELCGLAKFRDLDLGPQSTKWPSNINDDQLHPGTSSIVSGTNELTDIVFVAFRCELTNFAAGRIATLRQQGTDPSQWNLDTPESNKSAPDEALQKLEEMIETKYLRYCDPSQPLHLLTMVAARYGINVAKFLTHHPRRWTSKEQTPLSERQFVWDVCIKLLEQHSMVQSTPLLRRFAWHAAYFQQCYAFIHVLDVLLDHPSEADAEKAWQLIGQTYEHTPSMVSDMRKPINVAVGNLCLRAYSAREAAVRDGIIHRTKPPTFILQLREQREAARAKRLARNARDARKHNSAGNFQADARKASARSDTSVSRTADVMDTTYLQPSPQSRRNGLEPDGDSTGGDPFYFNEFEHGQTISLEMELDAMLAQDYNTVDSAAEGVSWEQWDAWLADSNVMRP